MRILFVTLFFPRAEMPGTENYTFAVAKGMSERGHDVRVMCAEDWSTGERYWNGVTEDSYGGVRVTRVHLNWERAPDPNRVLYDSDAVERWCERAVAKLRPDVVHVTSTLTLGLGVLRAVHRCGVPLVLTLMDFWFLCPRIVLTRGDGELCDGRTTPRECESCLMTTSNIFRRLEAWLPLGIVTGTWSAVCRSRPLARRRGARGLALDVRDRKASVKYALLLPDLILSHSRFVKRMFEDAGLVSGVRHLPNGHELVRRGSPPPKAQAPALRLGYMGQIAPQKGLHTLIEGLRLADLGHRVQLDVFGDPSTHEDYAASLRAMSAGSSSVTWRGAFDHADVGEVLADMDVLVVPSTWYENWPLVIQEAFASGTPVVATNLGGMAEAVTDGQDGLLFERENPVDLARQLRRLVDEPALLPSLSDGVPAVKPIGDELLELELEDAAVIARADNRPSIA